jgi:hypothetical protein
MSAAPDSFAADAARLAACLGILFVSGVHGCGSSSNAGSADAVGSHGGDDATVRMVSDGAVLAVDAAGEAPDVATPAGEGGAPHDAGPLPPDPCVEAGTCPPGQWVNVTPAGMDPSVLAPSTNAFGPGAVVGDPSRPSDLYVGAGNVGLWKSSDYGSTWTQINTAIPGSPIGAPIAVAGTTPATLWVNSGKGDGSVYRSTNGGASFTLTGGGQTRDLYSIRVDPYDATHLVSGLHEADGVVESTDGGDTWHLVGGAGWPAGGISWYPFFVDTGSAVTTRKTWFAIAQDGAAPVMTSDEGASWAIPAGLSTPSDAGVNGLQHPHGCTQLYQTGSTLFVGGLYGPGQGVYRSTDRGMSWSRVDTGQAPEAVVWGTPKSVYAMWGWACSDCNLGANFETSPQPGTTWSSAPVPAALVIGPNSVVVTSDGAHSIFVGAMWAEGLWRYVEP